MKLWQTFLLKKIGKIKNKIKKGCVLSILCMGLVYLAFNESARLNQIIKKKRKKKKKKKYNRKRKRIHRKIIQVSK